MALGAGSRFAAPLLLLVSLSLLSGARPALAADEPGWRCLKWNLRSCTAADLVNPDLRHVLILSTAYVDRLADTFWRDFEGLIGSMSGRGAGHAWSAQKRDQLLYVGYFTGGGPLGTDAATFGARIIEDPGGRPTLAVRLSDVTQLVDALQTTFPWLAPLGTGVLFPANDLTAGASANAAPPSFVNKSYGVAKFSASQVLAGSYTATHELGHAALNFLDEYVEIGLEKTSLRRLEGFRPRLVLDQSWGPSVRPERRAWDLSMTEILAGNGPVNLAPRRQVSSVVTARSKPEFYEYEGGMFFGRGSYHDAGSNLMNSNVVRRSPRDGFAYDHSPSQQQFIDAAFGDAPYRANDRLRNAGPPNGWRVQGPTIELLLYDGDKRNSLHATKNYTVQVGWWERSTGGGSRWVTAAYSVQPSPRAIEIPFQGDLAEEPLLLLVACRAGMTELSTQFNGREVCDAAGAAFLPTLKFYTPYQNVTVPAGQAFTNYWWRFRTNNGTRTSGWTGWSEFYRSF